MNRLNDHDGMGTKAVHAGVEPEEVYGSVNPPVHLTTTYVQPHVAQPKLHDYTRGGNPTRDALESAMATLEGGATGHAFSSGLAALDAVLHTMDSGDHIVCAEDAYGGTIRMLRQMASRHGIATTFVDTRDLDATTAAMTDATKWVFMETPTNPLLRVSDIEAVAKVAHDGGARLMVDNTFMSPILQRPLELGADLVMHSATKYIGGHSDVLAGILVSKEGAGERMTAAKTSDDRDAPLGHQLRFAQIAAGAVLSPFDCYMLLRGIKTLKLRMEAHCASAQVIAERLVDKLGADVVNYPGLPGHDNHDVHAKQTSGPGGMLSFVAPGGAKGAAQVAETTRLWQLAESLGAVESLIQVPAEMTHASVPAEMRKAIGLDDGLIRLSVGIEDVDDLWADLEQALDAL